MFKTFIFATLLLLTLSSSPSFLSVKNVGASPNFQPLIDFSIGFLLSIKFIEKVPSGFSCVNQINTFKVQLNESISKISTGQVDQIIAGFQELQAAVNNTLIICGQTIAEGNAAVSEIVNKLKNKTLVEQGLERIGGHLFEVIDDLKRGAQEFKNQSYFSAGVDIGKVFDLFLEDPTTSINFLRLVGKEVSVLLGYINLPYNDFGNGEALSINGITLDGQPAKGIARAINVAGSANDHADVKQVKIDTLLNGNLLNSQYDTKFTKTFEAGDDLTYSFSANIPSFAPSVNKIIFDTFFEIFVYIYVAFI
jgi:hypothetical protein